MELNTLKKLLAEILKSQHPVDAAASIEEFEDDDILQALQLLPAETLASIFEEASESLQKKIVQFLDARKIVEVFAHMSVDDITDILGILTIQQRKELFAQMKEKDSKNIQMLLGFEPDSAGGIMTTEYIALKQTLNVKEALEKIRLICPKTETIETIFIVNKNHELIGTVDLRNILTSPDEILLGEIMNEHLFFVYPDMDQEDVSLMVSRYDLNVIPVVSKKMILMGIITIDDILDVIVEEQTEDLLMLSGVSKDEKVGSSLSVSIHRRLPWLFVNLVTAFLASFTVGMFESVIAQVVALAAAMPIVAGMGGNSGSQTLSIVIRSIALGEVDIRKDWKFVFHEIALGIVNGSTIGFLTGIIMYFRYHNIYLSLIIFVSMIGNLMIAGLFGFIVPLFLKKRNLDPAVSSSIFLTTATDVGGFFIFLGLAKIFLPYLT